MLNDTPIPDELGLVEDDAVPFHAGQNATAKSVISRAANEQRAVKRVYPYSASQLASSSGSTLGSLITKSRQSVWYVVMMIYSWAPCVRDGHNHRKGTAIHLSLGARTSSSASSYHGVYVR